MLTKEQIENAQKFLDSHRAYVDKLVAFTSMSYPPTLTEDKNNPAWWKGAHWKWFLGVSLESNNSTD